MLRRVIHSRTFRDAVDVTAVISATALVLFTAGAIGAHWLTACWSCAVRVGAVVAGAYLPVAVAVTAAFAVPRFVRILRALRKERA